jgi:hypothetical protein
MLVRSNLIWDLTDVYNQCAGGIMKNAIESVPEQSPLYQVNGRFMAIPALGHPLQSYMRTVLVAMDFTRLNFNKILRMAQISDRTIKASQVFLGCMPVLVVYLFLQRYFTKGLVLGSVKG